MRIYGVLTKHHDTADKSPPLSFAGQIFSFRDLWVKERGRG